MSGAGKTNAPETEAPASSEKETEMLRRVRGKWALMHETEVVDFYSSREEAVAAGYDLLKDVPFMVRQVPSED